MKNNTLEIQFTLNGVQTRATVAPRQRLLDVLRDLSVYSVKRGCDNRGECGLCTVLLDGQPVKSCLKLAKNIDGHEVLTVEALNQADKPHPIQQAYMEAGAIQCGYCTPAMILRTKALLDSNPDPTVDEVRDALKEVECRCTGFVKILDAVRRASILLRGEDAPPVEIIGKILPANTADIKLPEPYYRQDGNRWPLPVLVFTPPEMSKTDFIGKPQVKVDARKLAEGQPVFTSDMKLKDMLHAVLLTSPHAHALIKNIDASKARALPGVHAVLTHKDLPRVKYSTGGQSYPQLPPYDQVSLDNKVRHVGDRVAIVAAETLEIARQAAELIEVDYEVLPAVFGLRETMQDGAPVIHDEPDTEGIYDAEHNIIYHIEEEQGDVTLAFSTADIVVEGEYKTPKQHHAQTEPHACL
ncbi:MAG: 2Fe-2S iron-sulfur cluster-binding protein, partial [Anaerolineaceae bacterium]|nr:2Fe-2S iron-sulfur cluster-binding protein [Anaerolineaceae bacterium]